MNALTLLIFWLVALALLLVLPALFGARKPRDEGEDDARYW